MGKKLILTIREVMLEERVDLVAGDLNGAAWRCDNRNNISIIAEEASADCALPMLPGPTPLWGPGAIPGSGRTFVDSSNLLILMDDGKFVSTAHSPLPMKLLVSAPTDQSCHHEAWLHLDLVEWRDEQPHREKHDRRILLKERSAPYHYDKQKGHTSDVMSGPSAVLVMGDHSASVRFERFPSTRTTRTCSPSDLKTLPLHLTATCVSFFALSLSQHGVPLKKKIHARSSITSSWDLTASCRASSAWTSLRRNSFLKQVAQINSVKDNPTTLRELVNHGLRSAVGSSARGTSGGRKCRDMSAIVQRDLNRPTLQR